MSWKPFLDLSYVPYSNKPTACVVESANGSLFLGVRIENISFPLTIPAVQAACGICLSEGETPKKIYIANENLEQFLFWKREFELEVIQTEHPPSVKINQFLHSVTDDFTPLTRLKEMLKQAVTPNSSFPVSALLFVEDGFFEGVNVEVSDWTKGICAERIAFAKAIAGGYRKFERMEIHTEKGEVSSPCGACRQVISELLPYNEIKLHHANGTLSEHISVDLLPFSFKSSALKKE